MNQYGAALAGFHPVGETEEKLPPHTVSDQMKKPGFN